MMFNVKQAEEERKMMGYMRGEGGVEMVLNEIPRETSLYHHLRHHNKHLLTSVSPISSCSSSSCISPSENGFSRSVTPFDETAYRPSNGRYFDSHVVKNSNGYMMDELDLSERFCGLRIGNEYKDFANVGRFPKEQDGLGFHDQLLDGFNLTNAENYRPFDCFSTDVCDDYGFQSSPLGHSTSLDDYIKAKHVGLPQGFNVDNSMGSRLTHDQSNVRLSDPILYKRTIDYLMEQTRRQRRGAYGSNGVQVRSPPPMGMLYHNDDFNLSQQGGVKSNGDGGMLNPLHSSRLMCPEMGLSVDNPICNRSILKQKTSAFPSGRVTPPLWSVTDAGDLEAFSCEDGFIIQAKSLKNVINKRHDPSIDQKKNFSNDIEILGLREREPELNICSESEGIFENGFSNSPWQPTCSSLAEIQGYIYLLSKDQQGCRFLQRIFDEGTQQDMQIIFNEIINHVVELMMNPFGNYLIQKLLDVCSEEQRTQIVLIVTQEPAELVKISLNTHGTRVVQKLIETLKTRHQIFLVVSALKPGFLDLIKDLNGNHVLQRCLLCLSKEDNKFIFDAATRFCVEIATHRHGCCVLNRCIAHSTGKNREKLAAEIANNGLHLAQDAFGNYVVQHVIELKIPSAASRLIPQFEGHFVYLSMQKFSSHVVEKCLKCFEESRSSIIHELVSVPHFEQLLQDPFANYVIQSALEVTKGPLHAKLVEAVRPHTILRTSPYCKKIFSRNLLKRIQANLSTKDFAT